MPGLYLITGIPVFYRHGPVRQHLRRTGYYGHMAAVQQKTYAAAVFPADPVLPVKYLIHINPYAVGTDTEFPCPPERIIQVRALQQRLGGDAAPVEAGPAKLVLFYQNHPEPPACRV